MTAKNTFLTFSNGIKVPQIGLGTYKSEHQEVLTAVKIAIEAGYRHIDTAYFYQNEKEIGDALKEKLRDGTVKREDLFVTTKLWGSAHRPEKVEQALRSSLQKLQLDYVDLYLMHSPMGIQDKGDQNLFSLDEDGNSLIDDVHYCDTWKAMENLVETGLTKSIGVSNFNVKQLEEVLKVAKIPIVVNQVENHPLIDQRELITFCKSKNILVTAYAPFGSPPSTTRINQTDPKLPKNPLVREIAESKGCSPFQLLIAYNLCQGLLCIPKSANASRIQHNFEALDIHLTDDEIEILDTMVSGYKARLWDLADLSIHDKYITHALDAKGGAIIQKSQFTVFIGHPHYPFSEELEKLKTQMAK